MDFRIKYLLYPRKLHHSSPPLFYSLKDSCTAVYRHCPSGCRLEGIQHLRSCMNFNASQTAQKLFTNSSRAASSCVRVCEGEEAAHRTDILIELTLLVGSCFYSVSSVSYLKTTKTLSRTIVQNSSANTWPWALSCAGYAQSISAGLPMVQGSAKKRVSRLCFPLGWLCWPSYQVGSQPTVDSSYLQEMPSNQCFKWLNCSCKQITAEFVIIPENAIVNRVILALPLSEMALCYLNLRKVSVTFWTDS